MTRFIAEVSSNHNGDLNRCLRFVDVAAGLGCWGIKFQLFRVDELFAPEALRYKPELNERRAWELPLEFLPHIKERCQERGIKFGCTPFYLKAVEELAPYVDFYKVASYEILWMDLLKAINDGYNPIDVILSTGMATKSEVVQAVRALSFWSIRDLIILHCVSQYPTPVEECNLRVIQSMRASLGENGVLARVGWSDHTVNPAVIYRAVWEWGARVIEFHLDLDGEGVEYQFGHCWLPDQIGPVIINLKQTKAMDGDGIKAPRPCEEEERMWRADPSDGLRPLKFVRKMLAPAKPFLHLQYSPSYARLDEFIQRAKVQPYSEGKEED